MLAFPAQTKDEIVSWLRAFFAHACPDGWAVVGISGGKDSSVTAALCAEALGRDRVMGVLMPRGVQSDIDDAKLLVATLGIRHITVNIGKAADALQSALVASGELMLANGGAGLSKDTKINLPARIRMTTLYAVAQSLPGGALVLNTCNKSEDWVGYATKFGDGAGDVSPLGNLLVEEVRQLGTVLGLPDALVHKTPTDGLSGQTDEDKLGFTYEVLDRYIATGEIDDVAVKDRIDALHAANLHKLMPMPTFQP
ncbi:MAG: NAD(+) synthase [Eggerthellaceae bacterium]|nr:NAD(+) synthase [Eggerthellaceae bacterium]